MKKAIAILRLVGVLALILTFSALLFPDYSGEFFKICGIVAFVTFPLIFVLHIVRFVSTGYSGGFFDWYVYKYWRDE